MPRRLWNISSSLSSPSSSSKRGRACKVELLKGHAMSGQGLKSEAGDLSLGYPLPCHQLSGDPRSPDLGSTYTNRKVGLNNPCFNFLEHDEWPHLSIAARRRKEGKEMSYELASNTFQKDKPL